MWEKNTCCIYHVELDELRIGLNKMRINIIGLHKKEVFVYKCTSIFLHFHLSMCGVVNKVYVGLTPHGCSSKLTLYTNTSPIFGPSMQYEGKFVYFKQ
jgi:hypothetical protein